MPIKAPTYYQLKPWRSVAALCDVLNAGAEHPTYTASAVRNLLAKRDKNGLQKFTRKLGGKVLISEPGFIYWMTTAGTFDHESAS